MFFRFFAVTGISARRCLARFQVVRSSSL